MQEQQGHILNPLGHRVRRMRTARAHIHVGASSGGNRMCPLRPPLGQPQLLHRSRPSPQMQYSRRKRTKACSVMPLCRRTLFPSTQRRTCTFLAQCIPHSRSLYILLLARTSQLIRIVFERGARRVSQRLPCHPEVHWHPFIPTQVPPFRHSCTQ